MHLCEWLFLARTRRVLQDSEDEQGVLGGEDQEEPGERCRGAEAFGRDGMGWHCITIWECELKPSKREETLKSLVFTLNKIWLDDHRVNTGAYSQLEEEGETYLKAAEKC